MAIAEREPITGVWGRSPHRASRSRAPAGGQGAKPLKLKAFLQFAYSGDEVMKTVAETDKRIGAVSYY